MPRSVILISAVSPELQSSRYLVANSLISLGYKPKWLDLPTTGASDHKAAIRKSVDRSLAVIQIVGQHYGSSPSEPDEEFGPVSYTQYEALYAHKTEKPVRYILLDEGYLTGCERDESAAMRKLQADYRLRVETHHDLYITSSTPRSTGDIVLNLREEFSSLRCPSLKRRIVPISLLFLLALTALAWQFLQSDKADEAVAAGRNVTGNDGKSGSGSPVPSSGQMEKILVSLPDAENRSRIPGKSHTQKELRTRAYTLLETEHGLRPGTLASSLPVFSLKLYTSPDSGLIAKATAAYALGKFEEAEALFLEDRSEQKPVTGRSERAATDYRTQRILALEGAAKIATSRFQYTRAVEHYRAAAVLTSVGRDPLEWGRIHHLLAYALSGDGQYLEATEILLQVIPVFEKYLGAEHLATLGSANNLASALNSQGKYAEAEKRHRELLAIRLRVLGAEHPDTLTSRSNLAATLASQGIHKQAEAEEQSRAVLGIRERLFGTDHYEVFLSCHNLALSLANQKKNAEALVFARRALDGFTKSLGADHPNSNAARKLTSLLESRLSSSTDGPGE